MSPVTTFLFVRHATTTGGPGDPGLSLEGRALARQAGEVLLARNATYVFSSPLRRAYQTAEEIALVLGLEILIDGRLRERANWGDVPGESWDDFLTRWDAGDGGRARERMAAFVRDISTRYPRATVVVVAHGGIVGDYLGGHEDWPHCGVTEMRA
jgi:2,3-bisphosphoglycerate-dependent phosphoglycerate mutase